MHGGRCMVTLCDAASAALSTGGPKESCSALAKGCKELLGCSRAPTSTLISAICLQDGSGFARGGHQQAWWSPCPSITPLDPQIAPGAPRWLGVARASLPSVTSHGAERP